MASRRRIEKGLKKLYLPTSIHPGLLSAKEEREGRREEKK